MHIIKSSKGRGGWRKFGSWYSSLEDKWVSLWVFPTKSKSRRSSLMRWWSHCCFNQVCRCKSCNDDKKIWQKMCCTFRVFFFFFAFFLVSVIIVVLLTLLVALPHKTIQYGTILEKTRRDLPTQKLICEVVSFCNYIIPDCISYQVICMWENKQRLGRQITSTAECGCSFQSLHIITCNIKHSQKPKCRDLSPPNTLYWSTAG